LRYGVTQRQYDEMFAAQGGRCAICREAFEVLSVDHDHVTGEVRGLLCPPCNIAIGNLADSPERAIAAARYLKDPPAHAS
jgi:hypothetical protein